MEWNDKIVMAKLLNNMKYKEAVELMKSNERNIDAQAVDMFITGFCLANAELLIPILPILERYISSDSISWRGRMRIALAIQQCEKLK